MSKTVIELNTAAADLIAWLDCCGIESHFVEKVRAKLAEQPAPAAQQELVAWGKPTDEMVQAATDEYDEWANENKGTTECIRAMLAKALKAFPQAQPAREPLTDEEMAKAWAVADGEHNASASVKRRITRAIEAAHNIKENQS